MTSPEDPGFAHTTPKDGLKVVKKINGDDANAAPGVEVAPGSDLNVTYVVTNTGNRPVFNVTVADKIVSEGDKAVENIATATPEKAKRLNPGESVEFTATIKAPAVGGAQHHDVASAHGVPPSPTNPNEPGNPDDPSNPPVNSPEDPGFARTTPRDGLRVVKKINNDDANTAPGVAVEPGADMNVTYEVTNTGNRPVFNVNVTDRVESENNAEVKNITPANVERVNPGETVTFPATIKAPAVGGVQHHDVAQAHGVPPSPTDPNRPAEPPSPSEPGQPGVPPSPSEPGKPGNPTSSSVPPSPSEPGKPGVPPSPDEPNRPGVPPVTSPEDPGFAHTTPRDGLRVVKKINN
ncbi:NEW3 domain-containing protein, partial [Corynebacterium bovis]|uniref:DUF7507 domain-containing protein n=1 Tax=Corynebacterium bovis TaxID=36808 RepID=UPI00313A56FE